MKTILLCGAGGPAGVNFSRSVKAGDKQIKIIGADCNKMHLEFNEYIDKAYVIPRCNEIGYIDSINRIIEKEHVDFLHPQPDIEVGVLSKNREKIKTKMLLPSKNAIEVCQDKFLSAKYWEEAGLATSKTILIKDEVDIKRAFSEIGKKIWVRARSGAGGRGSTLATNEKTANSWINYWRSRKKDWTFIAQEYLPGKNIAFQSIWKDGKLIISQARERIEYIYPYLAPSGVTGTPTIAKTINNDEVNKVATEAVLSIDKNATGIFCVDLKENKEGIICPTEINCGRFFTTSFGFTSLGIKLGINANMPYIYVMMGLGEDNNLFLGLKKYNCLPKDWYYLRHIDCGSRWVKKGSWKASKL